MIDLSDAEDVADACSVLSTHKADIKANAAEVILELAAEVRRLRIENDSLMSALADCREAAFVEEIDNPYLAGAVGDPLEVPGYVAYTIEWLTGMVEMAKGNPAKDRQ